MYVPGIDNSVSIEPAVGEFKITTQDTRLTQGEEFVFVDAGSEEYFRLVSSRFRFQIWMQAFVADVCLSCLVIASPNLCSLALL